MSYTPPAARRTYFEYQRTVPYFYEIGHCLHYAIPNLCYFCHSVDKLVLFIMHWVYHHAFGRKCVLCGRYCAHLPALISAVCAGLCCQLPALSISSPPSLFSLSDGPIMSSTCVVLYCVPLNAPILPYFCPMSCLFPLFNYYCFPLLLC